ncbi:TfoX/Sxy family protein [Solilutibacter silvestris]|uniref:TfoX N-terminal domain-containing protein n=1 Tax=Solilutibacter silvestris TaxID=1645665 RepID=A0A2K1Q3Z9_9GAMM|nr:TfoX/Sxy family protein [Lysobacter silvestris]PNS09780.1 TfoX N-terminal domain-containing protein [Lysobacter silvestris]
MATDRIFVDYVMEQAGLGSRLTMRRMFGEYAFYVDEKVVAFGCDNSLFLKPTAAAKKLVPHAPMRPPYPEAKDYPVIDELLDDGDALRIVLLATADELPAPKPKKVAVAKKVAPAKKAAAAKKAIAKKVAPAKKATAKKKR